jgi:hypothetical protein
VVHSTVQQTIIVHESRSVTPQAQAQDVRPGTVLIGRAALFVKPFGAENTVIANLIHARGPLKDSGTTR